MKTTFSNKCAILADVWMDYRDDEQFEDYVEFNDLGLPLAYCAYTELIAIDEDSPAGEIIDESFSILLTGIGLNDTGFEDLDQILTLAVTKNNNEK
jgi:hypothetical protein